MTAYIGRYDVFFGDLILRFNRKRLVSWGKFAYTGGKCALAPKANSGRAKYKTEPLIEITKYTDAVLPTQGNCKMILDATAPHTRVDNFVIDDYGDKIGAVGLGIYMVIKRHYNWATGQCSPSYNRIAQMCKVNRSTVIRYVKRLKEVGLINPQMRFTDDGQTSNQYAFYQPERPKPKPASAQKSRPIQIGTPAQMSSPVAEDDPPAPPEPPNQVVLNKKEEKENTKTMPAKEKEEEKIQDTEISAASKQGMEKPGAWKKTAPMGKTEKQQACPHPYAEVVTLFDGTTICNHCYDLINYEPEAEAA